jgi:hypothetical protein
VKIRRIAIVSLVAVVAAASLLLLGRLNPPAEAQPDNKPVAKAPAAASPDEITLSTLPEGRVALRIEFRSKTEQGKGKVETTWDGRVEVAGGQIDSVRLWADDPRDVVEGNQFTLGTHRAVPWFIQQWKGKPGAPQDAGLVVELRRVTPDSELSFETAQGNFAFKPAEIPWGGARGFLDGLVQVSRLAGVTTLLSAPTEDDYPSAATGPDGELYVAYVAFTHGEGYRHRPNLPEPPNDWDALAKPTGGDQVLLLVLRDGKWTGPVPVTPPGQDVYRTAAAVNGAGDLWVFWSASQEDNWDVYARRRFGEKWDETIKLTTEPGSDVFPVAATDSTGRVWVAWQAFPNGEANVMACSIEAGTPADPVVVSNAPGNQWAPAIAASRDGQVAVAWDSYEKGDYDVSCRVLSGGKWGQSLTVADSNRAEMRPAVTYDRQNRLWIAYEDSPPKWGKDWGAAEKDGVALYQGRAIAVRVWDGAKLQQPAGDPVAAFHPWIKNRQARSLKLAVPRLATDAAGRVWLAVRSPRLGIRAPVGTAWLEHLAFYEGDSWSDEIVCPGTDNILDNRPALVALPSGKMLMVASADGRAATTGGLPAWYVQQLRREGKKVHHRKAPSKWPDPVNNELVIAEMGPVVSGAAAAAVLKPAAPGEKPQPDAETLSEREAVARCREYRVELGGRTLRLLRGEFHRHTEISQDGGGDGLLMDMWRYGLDAAAMDWIGNGDHDNGAGREYSWWTVQKTTHIFQVEGAFTPMYSYERSCNYPDGHRNAVFAQRGVRTLPRLAGGRGKAMDELPADAKRPNTPDTQMLYEYLRRFDGVCASHTSATDMGTDWRDGDAKVEPIVEIYQGCRQNYEMPGAPRSNTKGHSAGGWRPFGFVSLALKRGYRLGFQASSDHTSTHISYCNVWAEDQSREAILKAMKERHVYGATDNILADVRCGEHFMGDEFTTHQKPKLSIKLVGTRPFARVHEIKDNNYVHTSEPGKADVQFDWTDFAPAAGTTSYYYVRGEQEDGELVWVSPMWITYKP